MGRTCESFWRYRTEISARNYWRTHCLEKQSKNFETTRTNIEKLFLLCDVRMCWRHKWNHVELQKVSTFNNFEKLKQPKLIRQSFLVKIFFRNEGELCVPHSLYYFSLLLHNVAQQTEMFWVEEKEELRQFSAFKYQFRSAKRRPKENNKHHLRSFKRLFHVSFSLVIAAHDKAPSEVKRG